MEMSAKFNTIVRQQNAETARHFKDIITDWKVTQIQQLLLSLFTDYRSVKTRHWLHLPNITSV